MFLNFFVVNLYSKFCVLFMFMKFYCVYFLFQLTEMVDGIIRDVATLTFRFEHDQSSGVPSALLGD